MSSDASLTPRSRDVAAPLSGPFQDDRGSTGADLWKRGARPLDGRTEAEHCVYVTEMRQRRTAHCVTLA